MFFTNPVKISSVIAHWCYCATFFNWLFQVLLNTSYRYLIKGTRESVIIIKQRK